MQSQAWGEALERVASSATFENHPALKRLLVYLARRSMAGETEGLKEYVVGVEALGKPPEYDPQTDASVRVQVSRLRKCLSDYYEKERPDDQVRIGIPRGHFLVSFEECSAPLAAPAQIAPRRLPLAAAARAGLLAACLLAAVAAWAVLAKPGQGVATPSAVKAAVNDLDLIWSDFLHQSKPSIIVLGSPLFAKFTTGETGLFFRDPRLNEWDAVRSSQAIGRIGNAVGGVHITQSRIYTGIGEARGAFLLGGLFAAAGKPVSLRFGHQISWEDYREHNVIVLGAPKHNLHVSELQGEEFFTFQQGAVVNRSPLGGEPEIFQPRFSAGFVDIEEDYAIISRLPGLHGVGSLMVLAGNSTEGTLAATEFATQPQYASELVARLSDATGNLPRHYQVVIRAKFKSQIPIGIQYVTHRLSENNRVTASHYKPDHP
jgi:hypothetical protein